MQSSLNMDYTQGERSLLEAIESGQLDRVVQLLSSGVEINTVLHSKARRESATVLGTAAYEGQLEILLYLIQNWKLSINYREPCLGRSALHWACMGGHLGVVRALLCCSNINVNCCDKDNVSPLIMASIYSYEQPEVIDALIEAGADANCKDRLNATALHYATDHNRSGQVIMSLVKAGCVASNFVVFGAGDPLANLIQHGLHHHCLYYLLAAGYKLQDSHSRLLDPYGMNPCASRILEQFRSSHSLKSTCRIAIRRNLGGVHLQKKIKCLPVPSALIQYLLLDKP